ncbi:ATP-binding protein [Thermosipho sp. 1223]|uniref:ATP-binding protein n=1 Tax=Thermosipho sp. 1223 TaxID=1643332 RepID=UPI0035169AC7
MYILRGPRQIGKTTVLKLLIRKLIKLGKNPVSILYVSLDMVEDNKELLELLLNYFNFIESFGNKKEKTTYIFLDEISSVKDWQKAIKHLFDTGLLENSFVILTGSSAYDLKRSAERLPGRRLAGVDIAYLPLTFKEFVEQKNNVKIRYHFKDLFLLKEKELKQLALQLSMYKDEFTTYLNSGGFPKVINDYIENSSITGETINTYKAYLYGDIERFNRSRFIMNQLLYKFPQLIGQRFSWNSIASEIEGINSKNTVESYMQLLGMNFLIGILFFYDFSKKHIKPKKQKKYIQLTQ